MTSIQLVCSGEQYLSGSIYFLRYNDALNVSKWHFILKHHRFDLLNFPVPPAAENRRRKLVQSLTLHSLFVLEPAIIVVFDCYDKKGLHPIIKLYTIQIWITLINLLVYF